MSDVKQRATNAMIGLAIGDAMNWTSMYHRSELLPPWTRRIRREMDAASETTKVITTPMPFSLNQPAEHMELSPALCTEWSIFSAKILLGSKTTDYNRSLITAWQELSASKDTVRGYVSTQGALQNLRNNILPPQSGKQTPHYFDDGAMPRAVPIGIVYSGRPEEAAQTALFDASVTNSEDGIWGAQAIAVAISLLTSGSSFEKAITEACQYLTKGSWIARTVEEARRISEGVHSIFSIVPELQQKIVNREYSYGNVAPETLALSFAIVGVHGGNVEAALQSASCFPKSAETLPSIVGALSGAMQPHPMMSDGWKNVVAKLKGIGISSLSGKEYFPMVEQLAHTAERSAS
jgi:ADP-ribosylglycohydrolase